MRRMAFIPPPRGCGMRIATPNGQLHSWFCHSCRRASKTGRSRPVNLSRDTNLQLRAFGPCWFASGEPRRCCLIVNRNFQPWYPLRLHLPTSATHAHGLAHSRSLVFWTTFGSQLDLGTIKAHIASTSLHSSDPAPKQPGENAGCGTDSGSSHCICLLPVTQPRCHRRFFLVAGTRRARP